MDKKSIIQESNTQETSKIDKELLINAIKVLILNEPSGIGEKIARIGSMNNISLLREANLAISNEKTEITYTDDLGSSIAYGSFLNQDIRNIKINKGAIKRGAQLAKPAVTGAIVGVIFAIVNYKKDGFLRGSVDNVLFSLFTIGLITAVFVAISYFKTPTSSITIASFNLADGQSFEIAMEDGKIDSLIAILPENISVDYN